MYKPKKQFEKAFEIYAEPIFRFCYFRIFDRERAQEIMQETFMKTWEYMVKGNEIDNIQAFLYRVARNLIINEIERRKPNQSLDEKIDEHGIDIPDPDIGNEQIIENAEIQIALKKIRELDPETRELMLMRYEADLSLDEIASVLGVTKNIVAVRIHRALEKLKKIYV